MDNSLENQIIKLVDDFINTMIELHNTVPGQEEELYALAEGHLLELTDKALMLLGGREEYLETMLSQLINQKLPQGAIMNSFDNFKEEMDHVVARTLEVYQQQQLEPVSGNDAWEDYSDADVEEESEDEDLEGLEEDEEAEDEDVEEYEEDDAAEYPEEWEEAEDWEDLDLDEDFGEDVDADEGELQETLDADDADDYEIIEDPVVNGDDEKFADKSWEPVDVDAIEGVEFELDTEIEESEISSGDVDSEEDPLGTLIRLAFPGQEIVRNYSLYDIVIDWFVQDLGLGFISPDAEDSVSNIGDLALRRAGITLVKVEPESIYNVKSFKRQLRRLQLENSWEDKRILDLTAE